MRLPDQSYAMKLALPAPRDVSGGDARSRSLGCATGDADAAVLPSYKEKCINFIGKNNVFDFRKNLVNKTTCSLSSSAGE